MFWTVIAISGDKAQCRGVYTDRESALNSQATQLNASKPYVNVPCDFIVLEWLSVYGYNRVFDTSGKEILGVSFFTWLHQKGNSREYIDTVISACMSAVEQYFAMRQAGSFSK